MANNVPVTPGQGATIAADDVAGVQYQRVKLVDGTEDSTADIPGDAANGLDVDVTRVQGSVAVTGTFWPGTQPVSGTVTANAGTGTFTVAGTVGISGTVTVDSELTTADLDTGAGTDTRAVLGLVLAESGGGLLVGSAHPMPVSGSVTVGNFPGTQTISGTVTANAGSGTFTVSGTVTANAGTGTFNNQQSNKTADYDSGAGTDTVTMFGIAVPKSGGAVAGGTSTDPIRVDPTGATTQPVSGTFWQATQPVSGTVTANAGSGTFTVSGTVTANIGTTNGLALDATLTGGTQKSKLVDTGGTNVATVSAAGALKVDGSAATQPVSGTVTANAGTGTFAVSGTVSITANSSINVAQLAGTTTDTNSGVKSAGTLRVVLATDQPQLTNKLLVTPDANSAINVAQVGGSSVVTAATGVQKVGIVGNAGATVDSTVAAGTAPTNQIVVGSVYNTAAPAPTAGQAMAQQADQAGNLRIFPGMPLTALAAWNSATALNATQTIFTNSGAEAVLVHLVQTTTLTAGAITFEVSYDGSTWVTVPADAVLDPASPTFAQIALPYTVQASTNKPFIITGKGWQALRIKLSTQITGTGSVTPNYALLPYDPAASVIGYSPTAANFNIQAVGNVATDGVAAGNPVMTAGRAQNALPSAVSTDGDVVPPSLDRQGVSWVRSRQLASYAAAYRLANATVGQLSLTKTFSTNTDVQLATIYHAAGATKIVKIRRVSLIVSTGAAGVFNFEIKPLSATTAPATGNPAITPGKFDPADAGAEATCLALPTTAGSLVGTDSPVSASFEWNAATAAATANPSGLAEQEIVLYDSMIAGPEIKPLTMRAATAEGYAVVGRCTAAVALRFSVLIAFTEE